ncbi:YD repeat-containing protein [Ohtaekwangia koreensis]|uniref:YD repeat-containing protein n=2 Tax=Ohtaekwangia koreensis TaxID=688867 RepID=A0A1T5MA53_9BACT|nr:YD repeat-containing protein [Ohtaekwangia koreensis]
MSHSVESVLGKHWRYSLSILRLSNTKLLLLFLLTMLATANLFGQGQLPKIIPPSPNAAALAKYGNIPISTYTGLPNVAVPIYEIRARDIKVPISISYHASGIKVSEESSPVGLGWVLNAGGVISRNVVNKDDFLVDPSGYLSPSNTSPVIPQGPGFAFPYGATPGTALIYYNSGGDPNGPTQNTLNLFDYTYGADYDFEPDQFNYNFGNYSGKFVLTRDRQVVLEKKEKVSIKPLTQDGSSWEAKTPDGFTYKFSVFEYFVDYNNTQGYKQKSAWYVTEIVSPQNEHVYFNYANNGTQMISPVGAYMETIEPVTLSCLGSNCRPQFPLPQTGTVPRKLYSKVTLQSITWTHGRVEFSMVNDRQDIEGDQRLESIKIFRAGGTVPEQEFLFEQNYFLSGNISGFPTSVSSEFLQKRLKLLSVTKQSPASTQKEVHRFTYYEDRLLPVKNSYAKDHWGYYNGRGGSSFIPSFESISGTNTQAIVGIMGKERDASASEIYAYSLKSVMYPTGGKSTFYYGLHDYQDNPNHHHVILPDAWQDFVSFSYDIKQRGTIEESTFDITDEFVDAFGHVVPTTINAAFRLNIPCKNLTANPDVYFELYNESGGRISRVDMGHGSCSVNTDENCLYCDRSTSSQSPVFTFLNTYTLYPGKYTWKAFINGAETRFENIIATYAYWVDSDKRPPSSAGPPVYYRIGGGLRIEKIEDYDIETAKVASVRKYIYRYKTDLDENGIQEERSYGKLMVYPEYSYFDVSRQQITDPGIPEPVACLECVHLLRQADSSLPLMNSKGTVVGYDKVIELFGEEGEFGKIEHEYNNEFDVVNTNKYPYNPAYFIKPSTVATTTNDLNGLLKRQVYFDATGKKVKEIVTNYESKFPSTIYGIEKRTVKVDPGLAIGPAQTIVLCVYPAIRSSFTFLESTTSTDFGPSEIQTSSVKTSYSYGNSNHLQQTQVIKEDKSSKHKTIVAYTYPADYLESESNSVIASMKGDKHLHDKTIQTTVIDQAPNGDRKVVERYFTEYQDFSGIILPQSQVSLVNSKILPENEVPKYIPAVSYDPVLYRKNYTSQYTSTGNIASVTKSFDQPVYYQWGYSNAYPVAEIRNATTTEVYYNGFEDNGTEGNLSLPAGAGSRYRAGGTYSIPFTPPAGRTYLMSYKYYSNGKWNTRVMPFTASITEGSHLDEVRVYPVNAQLTTYTYDPLYGVTSITDPNNMTAYYEYDAFGRLALIRDNEKKILKTFQYNYRN